MAPKTPRNKNKTATQNGHAAVHTADTALPALDYEQIQQDEILTLQAIFPPEDFEEIATQSAWSKTTDRSFKLKIRAVSKNDAFVVLSVKLTATYPKTAPILSVDGLQQFHERTVARISSIIEHKPKELLGSEMIFVITDEIKEALEDSVIAAQQGALPSLHVERASAEEAASNLAKEAEDAELRQALQTQEEEDRVLKQMVEEQLSRKEKRKSMKAANQISKSTQPQHGPEIVSFGRSAKIRVGTDTETFADVAVEGLLSHTGDESIHLGRPLIASHSPTPLVTVKRRKIRRPKADIINLETIMAGIQKLEHVNLLNVLAYRVNQVDLDSSELVLCREFADRGSLADLLDVSELHLRKARQFTIELLGGLEYLHSHGMAHGFINARSVYLTSQPSLSPKLSGFGYASFLGLHDDRMPTRWRAPEASSALHSGRTKDIWDLGVVAAQMFLGLDVPFDYSTPYALIGRDDLTDTFKDFLGKVFPLDAKKPVSCFELSTTELFRTDMPILQESKQRTRRRLRGSSSGFGSPNHRRSRHNSSNMQLSLSRFNDEFDVLNKLGKGGFGEVVRARNKLDQGIYAVKKIKAVKQLLEKVVGEVVLLKRLNHPYVVRYYNAWIENEFSGSIDEDAVSSTDDDESDGPRIDFGYTDTGELDFISSGHPHIEFGSDDDDAAYSNVDEEDDIFERDETSTMDDNNASTASVQSSQAGNLRLRKSRSDSHRTPSMLYIQMELCERKTLRNLITRGLTEDDSWRLVRQITEGLAHIHSNAIIHRDLKPDNVFIDNANNPKIGDFGLATTGQYVPLDQRASSSKSSAGPEMTRSVGTALYVAPELQSGRASDLNQKVDMYSLGIMFYEMCQHFGTFMERVTELQRIRRTAHDMSDEFKIGGSKATQGALIECLISHKVSERPSSAELLRDVRMPVKIEDDTVRRALAGLSDPSSPFHNQLMSALFARDNISMQRAKGLAWDDEVSKAPDRAIRVRIRGIVRASLEAIFRKHGAEEVRRQFVFPLDGQYYDPSKVFKMFDQAGNLLQLPFDLVLPYARQLARQPATTRCTFTFSGAYRERLNGGPPVSTVEADFDIVNQRDDESASVNDAEALKVLDEALTELPEFAPVPAYFLVTHGLLIDAILDLCRVPIQHQHRVKEVLSNVGVVSSWETVRKQLADMGIPDTTLNDLPLFEWKSDPAEAFVNLRRLFENALPRVKAKCEQAIEELRQIVDYAHKFEITRKIFIAPISCFKVSFYATGVIFQVAVEKKNNDSKDRRRKVLAAGGRYDSLIRDHQVSNGTATNQGAVGIAIAVDPIVDMLIPRQPKQHKDNRDKYLKDPQGPVPSSQLPKRCNVLVVASGSENVRGVGIGLVAKLWASNISAEMARDNIPFQQHDYLYVVYVKHETSSAVQFSKTEAEHEVVDIPIHGLVPHIQQELRDRSSSKARIPLLRSQSSQHEGSAHKENAVQVLTVRHGGKKTNREAIVARAHERWEENLEERKEAPILAIEGHEDLLDLLQATRLSDGESWRRAIQSAVPQERQYVGEIRQHLESWRGKWMEGEGVREACVYHFRTQKLVAYDLGA